MTELRLRDAEYGIEMQDRCTRSEVVQWIMASQCDYAVTLALNTSMPFKRARERVSEWLYSMDRVTRKCRPERVPHDKRLTAFIMPEHLDSNIHFHLAMRLVDGRDVTEHSVDTVIDIAKRQWGDIQPSGSITITPVADALGWGRYMTKDHYKRGVQLILSTDFHNPDRFQLWKHNKSKSAWG